MVELIVFVVAGAVCLGGAVGVVALRNPVHNALSLVATLFGIAVLFVAQEAHFLAAVQVIVYAGAIVVLFLFVLMLLGVDRAEDLSIEPLPGQRIAAAVLGVAVFALPVLALASTDWAPTGVRAVAGSARSIGEGTYAENIAQLGESIFTTYVLAFEITAVLLVIAVVGAVVLAKTARRVAEVDDPLVAAAEEEARARAEAAADTDDADTDDADADADTDADDAEVTS
jgi:NADH-quinone oxidoreductase subunit J